MDKSDGSYRSEYEEALKHAAATSLTSKTLLTRTNENRSLQITYTVGSDTVCTGLLNYECVTYRTPQISSTLMTFTLAMVENPHVWKRAQAEIDAVVGTDRLPEFDDRPSLPYVDAIMREVLRWQPVLPLCMCWKERVLSEAFLNLLRSTTRDYGQ